jgi:molecular chaperone HscA
LLGDEQQQEIARLMEALRKAIAGTDHRAIKAAVDRLNKGSEEFAALRMDNSVKRALTGKSVDKLGV